MALCRADSPPVLECRNNSGCSVARVEDRMRGMNDLVRQAQIMQKKMAKVQEDLATRTVEGTSGGGMVVAVVNGANELQGLRIDASVVDPGDVEMLQDLIVAAVADGVKKSKEMAEAEMGQITGGMKIPGLF